jgi:iron complex outermembrane receptor protein
VSTKVTHWKWPAAFLGAAIGLSSGIATTAFGADAATADTSEAAAPGGTLQEVVVTGSHIARAEGETAQNVQQISAVEIQNSGQETVSDYLRTISSTFGNNSNESFENSFAPGSAMVGLRGLSGTDTLVLLNGRRITNYGVFQNLSDAFVDLNVIPLAAIDHIEILKSGGSAIYGSDAIAGVINIILKQKSTEKAVEVGGTVTTDGGAAARDANIRVGFGDFDSQGYNVFLTASAFKRDQLLFSQRSNTSGQDYSNLPDGFLAWRLSQQYKSIPGPFPTCGTNGLPGVVTSGTAGPGCYYNDADQLPLMPAATRANLTGTANLRLTDNWTAYSDIFFSNEDTHNNFTPAALSAGSYQALPATGGAAPVSDVLPGTNPSALGGAPTPINYAFQSVGRRDAEVVSNTWRITAGVKGTVAGFGVDAGFGHSENHVSFEGRNYINAANIQADIADGSFNFLDPLSTPAANSALNIRDTYSSVAKLDTFDLNVNHGLFELPGGQAKLAVGAEVRHESVNDQPGAAAEAGLVLSTGITRVVASRTVYAAFGEFDFPILKSLDADVAVREEHYGDVGSTGVRPQYTLRYQPFRQLTLRASFAQGFRAPSMAESSNSTSLANNTVVDPMDPQHRPNENVGFITGGNPNVRPETSKNLDLGVIVSPIPNLDLSADFYNLYLYDVIAPNATAQAIINDPAAFPGELVRAPDGTVVYAKALYTNQFEIHTSGVDVNAGYSIPLQIGGRVKFGLDATYVRKFEVNSAGTWSDFTGTNGWDYLSPIAGGGPVPHWKGVASLGWSNPDWSAGAALRYFAGYQNSITAAGFGTIQQNIASFDALDLNAEYRGLKNWKFALSIVNVTNRYPPYDSAALNFGPTGTPYDAFTYDDMGRMVDLHITFSL